MVCAAKHSDHGSVYQGPERTPAKCFPQRGEDSVSAKSGSSPCAEGNVAFSAEALFDNAVQEPNDAIGPYDPNPIVGGCIS